MPKRAQKPGPPPPGGPGTNSIPGKHHNSSSKPIRNSFLLPSQCISIADHLLELRTTTTPTKENTKVHSQKLTKQSESE